MKKGDKVFYKGEKCEIYFSYESGYCEIKSLIRKNIMLVHQTEILKIEDIYPKERLSF